MILKIKKTIIVLGDKMIVSIRVEIKELLNDTKMKLLGICKDKELYIAECINNIEKAIYEKGNLTDEEIIVVKKIKDKLKDNKLEVTIDQYNDIKTQLIIAVLNKIKHFEEIGQIADNRMKI